MGRSTAWLAALTVTMLGAAHVLGGHPQAQADCEPPTLKEAAADANAVFVGTTVQQVAGGDTFEVRASDIYKGSPGAFLDVTGSSQAEDGVALEPERQYLFFVTRDGRSWVAMGCGATRPISSLVIAQADLALGPATPLRVATPNSGPSESLSPSPEADDRNQNASESVADDHNASRAWVWVGIGVALLVGGGIVTAALRRVRGR